MYIFIYIHISICMYVYTDEIQDAFLGEQPN